MDSVKKTAFGYIKNNVPQTVVFISAYSTGFAALFNAIVLSKGFFELFDMSEVSKLRLLQILENMFFGQMSSSANALHSFFVCILSVLSVTIVIINVHSLYRTVDRRFYSSLLMSGANIGFIKAVQRYKNFFCLSVSVLPGLIEGYAFMLAVRKITGELSHFFGSFYSTAIPELKISPDIFAAAAAAAIVALTAVRSSKKAYRGLSIKNISEERKSILSANIGLRAFSEKPKKYQRRGIEHIVAVRSFSNRILNYINNFFNSFLFSLFLGFSIMIYSINGVFSLTESGDKLERACAINGIQQVFFITAAVLILVNDLLCSFYSVISCTDANTGEYMLMRSLGSSFKAIKKCVMTEGIILISVTVLLTTIVSFTFWYLELTAEGERLLMINYHGLSVHIAVVVSMFWFYALTVGAAVLISNKKLSEKNVVSELKGLSY
ncbi:MAG: hypothetical protein IJU45_08410 [Clostridia bacterium]|nr:hypothetical protein [Clostridia bacterium]